MIWMLVQQTVEVKEKGRMMEELLSQSVPKWRNTVLSSLAQVPTAGDLIASFLYNVVPLLVGHVIFEAAMLNVDLPFFHTGITASIKLPTKCTRAR